MSTALPLVSALSTRLRLRRRETLAGSTACHVLTFDGSIDAEPGQFAMIRGAAWGQSPLLPRPMSLLTSGEGPSILIEVVGEGTRRLALASPGEPFDLLAPLGRPFREPPRGRRAVLVAGGAGVAPLLFLARGLAASSARPLALFGGRTSADLPLADELAQVAELRVATEDGSRGARGNVTVLLEEALDEVGSDRASVFTRGPEPMMAAVARIAASRAVPCQASLETPMACGYGVCLGCPVPRADGKGFLYACVEGPCVDAATIAWPHPEARSLGEPPKPPPEARS